MSPETPQVNVPEVVSRARQIGHGVSWNEHQDLFLGHSSLLSDDLKMRWERVKVTARRLGIANQRDPVFVYMSAAACLRNLQTRIEALNNKTHPTPETLARAERITAFAGDIEQAMALYCEEEAVDGLKAGALRKLLFHDPQDKSKNTQISKALDQRDFAGLLSLLTNPGAK